MKFDHIDPDNKSVFMTFQELPDPFKAVLTEPTCLFNGVNEQDLSGLRLVPITMNKGEELWRQDEEFFLYDHSCLRVIVSGQIAVSYKWNDEGIPHAENVAVYGPCFVIGEMESCIRHDIFEETYHPYGAMVTHRHASNRVHFTGMWETITAVEPTQLLLIYDFFPKFKSNPRVMLNLLGIVMTKLLISSEYLTVHRVRREQDEKRRREAEQHRAELIADHDKILSHKGQRFERYYLPNIEGLCVVNSQLLRSRECTGSLEDFRTAWFRAGHIKLSEMLPKVFDYDEVDGKNHTHHASENPSDLPRKDLTTEIDSYHVSYGNPINASSEAIQRKDIYVSGQFLLDRVMLHSTCVPTHILQELRAEEAT